MFIMPETKNLLKENSRQSRQLAKRHHETLWLGSRFLKKDERNLVEAALAFDGELLGIASSVSEGMIAQIRYQWWRDKLSEDQSDHSRSYTEKLNPVQTLMNGIGRPATALLTDLINSREDVFLGEAQAWQGNKALFLLLSAVIEGAEIDAKTAKELGVLYVMTEGVQHPVTEFPETAALTALLRTGQTSAWSVLCIFTFIPSWLKNQNPGPLLKRWMVWKGFLRGEKALLKILSEYAQAS